MLDKLQEPEEPEISQTDSRPVVNQSVPSIKPISGCT